jgi:tetratricopeptide (TPR) repeat protein
MKPVLLAVFRPAWLCAAALLLTSCGSAVKPMPAALPAAPAQQPVQPRADAPALPTPSPQVAEFEAQHRRAAQSAVSQGRWADVLWAQDVLLALNPGDAELTQQRQQAESTARKESADRLERARQSQLRGDADTAWRLYLEALLLRPDLEAAAAGLRSLERERVKRQHLGQLSRNTLLRRAPNEVLSNSGRATAAQNTSAEGNELEHASLLAAQGETDAAIAVLLPAASTTPGDTAQRRLLAELYFRKAEKLAATDRPAAIVALQQSLLYDPGPNKTALRLKQLIEARQPGAAP